MNGNRGCIANTLLFLILVFVPIVGHIILTIMVLEDNHSLSATVLWIAVIWLLPFIGPLLYLLFGQTGPRRVMFGQPSYAQSQSYR